MRGSLVVAVVSWDVSPRFCWQELVMPREVWVGGLQVCILGLLPWVLSV